MNLPKKMKDHKKQKNYTLLYVLVAMIVLVYFVTLIKLSS